MFHLILIVLGVLIAIPILEFLGIMFVGTMYGLWYMVTYPLRWLSECARAPRPVVIRRIPYTPAQMESTPIRYSRTANAGRVNISPRTDPL